MENRIKIDNKFEELKEREEIYCQCLNLDDFGHLTYPSLKYTVYNMKISKEFKNKITQMKNDINELKDKLNKYKGNRIDSKKEIKKLDNIDGELTALLTKDNEDEEFYETYLIHIAKRADTLKNEIAKNVYTSSSEQILKSRIEYFLKCEKKFLIFNDFIQQLKYFFNI